MTTRGGGVCSLLSLNRVLTPARKSSAKGSVSVLSHELAIFWAGELIVFLTQNLWTETALLILKSDRREKLLD